MNLRRSSVVWFALISSIAIPAIATGEAVIGTTSGKVYHNHPEACASARRIRDDRLTRFASRAEAEAAGRRQCRTCERLDEKGARPPESAPPEKPRVEVEPREADKDLPPPPGGDIIEQQSPRIAGVVRATAVLDAGTLTFDTGDRAFLAGVIVPSRTQPMARDAQRFIVEQTRDRLLRATVMTSPCAVEGRDALGRWCVAVSPQPGGRDLAGELLFQGYAWLDRSSASTRSAEYARLEEAAWRARRGIWSELKDDAAKRQVTTGRGAWEYHDERCDHVAHLTEARTMPLNEARARRLVPCCHYRAKGGERSSPAPNINGAP